MFPTGQVRGIQIAPLHQPIGVEGWCKHDMPRQKHEGRPVLVISDGSGEIGRIVCRTAGETAGVCKYFRITEEGWRVLEEWLETPHSSYKAREQ